MRYLHGMNVDVVPFSIEAYDEVLALWGQCEGVGLSKADSRENIAAYLDRNPGTIACFALLLGLEGN